MTPTRIVLLSHTSGTPALTLVIADGRVVERGELHPHPAEPPAPLPCILIVPGAEALARWLELSVRTEAQAGPAAAILLEEQLATRSDQLHLTLAPPEEDGSRLAVVLDRAVLDRWIDEATSLGVYPDVILPDHLALPEQAGEDVVAVRFGELYAVRGRRLALSSEAELLPLVLGERPWREITDADEIEAMLVSAAAAPRVNLLQTNTSVTAPPSTWGQLRAAVLLAGLLVLSPLVLTAVSLFRHEAAARELDARTEARVRAALPGQAVGDPDAELRARAERLRAADQFPVAVAALFTALQSAGGMELDALSFESGQPLRATVSFAGASDLDLFRATAQRAGFQAEATPPSNQAGRFVSQVSLSRAS